MDDVQLAKSDGPRFDQAKFTGAAKHIHERQEFTPQMMQDEPVKALTRETYTALSAAINIGREVPPELRVALEENTFIFSGFKTYQQLREVSCLLKDEDGGFKSFEAFSRDIQQLNDRYNKNYLRAEYNYATQSTQMAVKWHDFVADGDDYLLQYRTSGDDRVRAEHAALHGVTLPIGDAFWDEYLPPLDWGCRCTVVQVPREKYQQSDPDEAKALGEAATAGPKKKIFRFNPGKTMKIFPPKHPYYKADKQDKDAVQQIVEEQSKDAMWESGLPNSLSQEEKDALIKNFKDIESGLGVTKGRPMTYEEADKQKTNPNLGKGQYNGINCQTCAPAYMLRLHGFDIIAKPNTPGSKLDWLSHHWSKCWKNIDGTDANIESFHSWMDKHGYKAMTPARYMAFFKEVCKEPGIYELGLSWKKNGGHCTIIEKMKDGTLRYIEPQRDNSPGSGREWDDINGLCRDMTAKPYYSRTGIIGKDNEDGVIRIDNKVFDKSLLEIFSKGT